MMMSPITPVSVSSREPALIEKRKRVWSHAVVILELLSAISKFTIIRTLAHGPLQLERLTYVTSRSPSSAENGRTGWVASLTSGRTNPGLGLQPVLPFSAKDGLRHSTFTNLIGHAMILEWTQLP